MMPKEKGPNMDVEVKFAQKLAGNEKEGRDKALKKLKRWIQLKSSSSSDSSDSSFTELELLKLWKGLFYCMWMSDKPLIQEQLAEELSQLVHLFPHSQDAITFCSTFFTTMAREWHSIDSFRRDKFMMLVRRVLRQSLALAAGAGWEGPVAARLMDVYRAGFARPEDKATLPLGLQLHLVEICLEEVAKVGADSITEQHMAALLAPFINVLKVSRESVLRSTVTDSVFYHLMRQSDVGMAHEAQLNGDIQEEDSEWQAEDDSDLEEPAAGDRPLDPRAGGVDVLLPQLPVDYARLADDLVAAGAGADVRQVNRAALYRLAQQFRDLSEGVYPLALKIPDEIDSDSDISDEDIQAAVQRLQKTKQQINHDSRKNKRRRADADDEPEEAEEAPQPKKKKKLKHKLLTSGVIDRGEEMLAETSETAAASEQPEEPSEPPPTAPSKKKTLKERRREKLKAKKELEAARKERKRQKREAKQVMLNGDAAGEEVYGMVNGIGTGGVQEKKAKKKGKKHVEAEESVIAEDPSAEVERRASIGSATKKKKKKSSAKVVSESREISSESLEEPTTPKKKTPKKSAVTENGSIQPSSDAFTETATPSTPKQKKLKNKKAGSSPASPAESKSAAASAGDASSPVRRPAFDWTLSATDDWGEPASPAKPAARVNGKAASEFAHFVPSRPVPAFVKTRAPKKATPATPKTPTNPATPSSVKKVKICLSENKSQGFREHLMTVRNSPQVPHNPALKPVKGLLKTPTSTGATPKAQPRRRSHAADFFGV